MRKLAFWFLDFLQGHTVRDHYGEIKSILADPFGERQMALREKNLQHLLEHVGNTVPFYRDNKFPSIEEYPVINKKTIQNHPESFKSSSFGGQPHFKVATSGSTGVPFILFHDKNKRKRNTADLLYFSKRSGYDIGNQLFELEVWRAHNKRGAFKNFKQNTIQFDVTKLTDQRIEEFLSALSRSSKKKNILGFPSALESICKYMEANSFRPEIKNLKSITANSEYLNDYTRKAVEQFFRAPIYSRYSSEELGIIAHQTEDSGQDFVANLASYHIEVLDMDKDVPAPMGSYGRLVITDLFNCYMPLVRYDTGDVGIFDASDPRLLKTVEGRKMDMVYDTQGNMLSPYVVYTKFYPFYHLIDQFQFFQVGEKEYHIKMNLKGAFEFERELIGSIKEDFGEDSQLSIELVDEIPPLSSGKRKKVVNLYHHA